MSKFSVAVLLLALVLLVTILGESEAKRGGKKGLKACKCKLHPNGNLSCRKSPKSNDLKLSTIKCLCRRSFQNMEMTDKLRKTLQKLCRKSGSNPL